MLIYATSTDLAAWTGASAPANAATLLRSASLLIRTETTAALYPTDTTGLPTDATTLQAFKDAACAQAAFWSAAGIDPASGGISTIAPTRRKKVGSAELEYDTSAQAAAAQQVVLRAATHRLCAEAYQILTGQNLLTGQPWVFG